MKKIMLFVFISLFVSALNAQTDSTLKQYTGRFLFPEGSIVADVTVVMEAEGLSMISSAGTSLLTKLGKDSFTIVEFSGLAVFKRSEAKVINGIFIDAAGYVMDGVKEVPANGISFLPFIKPEFAFIENERIIKF